MTALGIRCSHKDVTYVVLKGVQAHPKLVTHDSITFPTGFGRAKSLHWLVQEIDLLVKQHTIELIAIKKFEGRSKGNDYETRVEHEAAIAISAANNGILAVYKKGHSTIAKDLGVKGRKKYLAELDTSCFSNYDSLKDNVKDALLVAWSTLY